jgi:PAS domain S-box-containing protein
VSKTSILALDDGSARTADIRQRLMAHGYDAVARATSGDEAIALASQVRPDLVLIDIGLTGEPDGVETARLLRDRLSLPTVFLAASCSDQLLARSRLVEPLGYVFNPSSDRELFTSVDVALHRHRTELGLRESGDHARAMLDILIDGVISIDERGTIATFSPSASRIFGYPPDEVVGRNIKMLMPEPYQSEHDGYLRRYLEGGEPTVIGKGRQVRGRRRDGSTFPMDLAVSHLTYQGRRRYIGLVRDISERQEAEEQLRESEENLSITLRSIGDAVIATDAAGRVSNMNPAAERLTGWPLTAAAGRPLSEVFRIVNADTRLPLSNPVDLVMERGDFVGLANHAVLLARDGREYQISDSAAPIRNAAQQIVGVVLVFSDVTEAYQAQQALFRNAELLNTTGELARVGGWENDLRTGAVVWHPQTCALLELDDPSKTPSPRDRFGSGSLRSSRSGSRSSTESTGSWT